MLRHKTNLKGKKLCHNKEILCHDIFKDQKGMKSCLQQRFLCLNKRNSCRDNYYITLAELCCDICKLCHDRIQEESMKPCCDRKQQAMTNLGTKMTTISRNNFLCRDKANYWADFWGSTISAFKCGPSFENL